MSDLNVQKLIDAGVHFGCRVSRWNPKMAPYIHGRRNNIHVIDLRATMRGILRAKNLLLRIASEGQSVLWVGTKRQVKGVIADAGERTGMPIVTERWIGGTLTNFSVIRSRLKRLEALEAIDEKAIEEQKLTKKEVASLTRERRKITRNLGGIREMKSMPGAMVVVDPSREVNAAREARKMGVVTIGMLDTDCNPNDVDIVIPGNDDALKSVRLIIEELSEAVEAGWHHHREEAASIGEARRSEEVEAGGVTDDVRPTRTQRAPRRDAASGSDQSPPSDDSSGDATPDTPAPTVDAVPAPAPAEPPAEPASEPQAEPQAGAEAKVGDGEQ